MLNPGKGSGCIAESLLPTPTDKLIDSASTAIEIEYSDQVNRYV